MKSILICLVSTILLGGSANIDNMMEYTAISVNKNNSEEKALEIAKISYSQMVSGKIVNTMKVKGAESTTKLKKGNSYDFFVRYTLKEQGRITIVKFDIEKEKRVLQSVDAVSHPEKNNKYLKFIKFTSEYYNQKKNITKVNITENLEPGSYAILAAINDGKTIQMGNLTYNQAFLFDIVQ